MMFSSKGNDPMCTVSMGTQLLKNMNQGFGRYLGTMIVTIHQGVQLPMVGCGVSP